MLGPYAQFIREKYAAIIISTLVLGIIVGLFTPAPGMAMRKISSALIVIMIGAMGFTITFKSLGTAVKDWKSFVLGLVLNFAFAPLLCWFLGLLILSNHPELAIGLILVGVVPCAGMALVWAGLLKGDVPLATVINAATMIVAPFLIPLLMNLLAGTFLSIDTAGMFRTVMLTAVSFYQLFLRSHPAESPQMAGSVPLHRSTPLPLWLCGLPSLNSRAFTHSGYSNLFQASRSSSRF